MPAPHDPRAPGAPPADPKAPKAQSPAPVSAQRLAKAQPESTVTLMIQSGQAPGAVAPQQASRDTEPASKPGLLARAWAAIKGWF